ncbi:MAG: glyoxalase [Solirubrobacteraceae bacterium]
MAAGPQVAALAVADAPERWSALGFTVDDGCVALGGVRLELGGAGSGITGWTLNGGGGPPTIDGLPTTWGALTTAEVAGHPNSARGVDHVVIVTPHFDHTSATLDAAGLTLRRARQAGERRQGFRRLGPTIMEIVEAPEAEEAAFWGLTITVADLELVAAHAGGHLSPVRPAVQPGRQIATLGRDAGLSTRLAFMDAEPGS